MSEDISYRPGSLVRWHRKPYRIVQAVTADSVLLEDMDGGTPQVVPVRELSSATATPIRSSRPLDALDPADLEEAKRRFAIIKPLVRCERRSLEQVLAQAAAHETTPSTIYRWIKTYEGRRLLSDLAPQRRGRAMPRRLDPKIEAIIESVIREYYLSKQNPDNKRTIDEIHRRCRAVKLPLPSKDTIYIRLKALDPQEVTLKRRGAKAAHDKFGRVIAAFPGADGPEPRRVCRRLEFNSYAAMALVSRAA